VPALETVAKKVLAKAVEMDRVTALETAAAKVLVRV
jgi:hypothetical protein